MRRRSFLEPRARQICSLRVAERTPEGVANAEDVHSLALLVRMFAFGGAADEKNRAAQELAISSAQADTSRNAALA